METTGKALVDHWSWAAEKGLMNRNTAGGMRSACAGVLSVLGDLDAIDVKTLDVEQALVQFQNLKAKGFKPKVLETYKRRFRQGVASYLSYVEDPGGWKPRTLERPAPQERNGNHEGESKPETPSRPTRQELPQLGFVEYPYPVREGQIARLILPRDLKMTEVKRLSAFMATLAADFQAA